MSDESSPVLRVVAGGDPSDDELAVLVAVVAAFSAGSAPSVAPPAERWRTAARLPYAWGRHGWLPDARRSALRRPL